MDKRKTHKLTEDQKREIWKLYNDGFSPNAIAKQFGITRLTVYKIGKDTRYEN